jgi:hypothetical protein
MSTPDHNISLMYKYRRHHHPDVGVQLGQFNSLSTIVHELTTAVTVNTRYTAYMFYSQYCIE